MKIHKLLGIICFLAISTNVCGQQKEFSDEELQRYEDRVKDITGFFFYLLNTIASDETSPFEKEIIVTESYKKYFRDEKVQVEDDLDERRVVPTNKDISAYLKDVDFFFKDANFEFEIEEITHHTNDEGTPYFKVKLTRRLTGITVEDDTINNTLNRFIEVNVSNEDQDLRIASIYTTKLSEKDDLLFWWSQLSFGWKEILKEAIKVEADSLTFEEIQKITSLKAINLRDNALVNSLDPLSKLKALERIDISHTNVDDLSPLRNLTRIRYLDATNTKINNIDALRYTFNLTNLFIDDTAVDSIDVVANLKNLQYLSLRNTQVNNLAALGNSTSLLEIYASNTSLTTFHPLEKIATLQAINVEYTQIDSLPGLQALVELKSLNISNTGIEDLEPVMSLHKLEEIRFDNTRVNSLKYLDSLNSLKRVYCDNTGISRSQAANFMAKNPGTLIIFASDRLFEWWKQLTDSWKDVLIRNGRFQNSLAPTKEELASLTRLDSLYLSNSGLNDLSPLSIFHQIYVLDISGNNLSDLQVLKDFDQLRKLDISNNPIDDINILNQLQQLQQVKMNGLHVNSLTTFLGHQDLQAIYADNTELDDESVKIFHMENEDVLIVYKSDTLESWWNNLSEEWQEAFQENLEFSGTPDNIMLHKIIFLKSFDLSRKPLDSLYPLRILLAPESISLNRLSIQDLSPLSSLTSVENLEIIGMPVTDLNPLSSLNNLESLKLSDTPIDDLEALDNLRQLKSLDISSTQIKTIKPLLCLINLESLNIANTKVRKLKHLHNHKQLQELICYNTRVSSREIEKFKKAQPECRVVYYR